MILAYTRDASGAGDNFRIMNLFAMSYQRHRNTEEDFNPRFVCFARQKFPLKEGVAIHSLILGLRYQPGLKKANFRNF